MKSPSPTVRRERLREAALGARQVIASLPLLRNWYIGYVLLVFGVGGYLLWPTPEVLVVDGIIYIAVFLLGYRLQGRWAKSGSRLELLTQFAVLRRMPLMLGRCLRRSGATSVGRPGARVSLTVLRRLLLLLLLARLGVIAYEILFVYGFRRYFSGAALVFQIQDYGRFDIGGGWFVVLTNALSFSTIAASAYYLKECLVQKSVPRFGLVVALLVGLPILALQRSSVLFGVAFVGVAYLFSARMRGQNVVGKVVAVAIAGALALGVGVYVGLLRENALSQGPVSGQLEHRVLNLAEGEMSPIVVYATFKADVGNVIDYQYGRPILGPLVFKVVPRNWYPDKPTNSGAFYASHYQPAAFAAGFAIAPTLWGALYLNFGYVGTVLGSFLLGVLTARLDRIYTEGRVEELGWFLIIYYNYYSLLRDDISNVLGVLLITGTVFLIMQWLLDARAQRDSIPSHSVGV
jgi:oligosaccharide repeat unit polymerase